MHCLRKRFLAALSEERWSVQEKWQEKKKYYFLQCTFWGRMRMFKLSAFQNDCNDLLPLWGPSHRILLCHDRCLPTTPKNTYKRLVKTQLFSSFVWFVRKSNIFTFVLAGLLLLSHGHWGSSQLRNINWHGALVDIRDINVGLKQQCTDCSVLLTQ